MNYQWFLLFFLVSIGHIIAGKFKFSLSNLVGGRRTKNPTSNSRPTDRSRPASTLPAFTRPTSTRRVGTRPTSTRSNNVDPFLHPLLTIQTNDDRYVNQFFNLWMRKPENWNWNNQQEMLIEENSANAEREMNSLFQEALDREKPFPLLSFSAHTFLNLRFELTGSIVVHGMVSKTSFNITTGCDLMKKVVSLLNSPTNQERDEPPCQSTLINGETMFMRQTTSGIFINNQYLKKLSNNRLILFALRSAKNSIEEIKLNDTMRSVTFD